MCPNTPYLGGLWASCPLRYPRRCFSLGGSHFEEGWDQAGGQSPGSLIAGVPAQPLTSSCGGTSPLFSKALWWVGGVATRAQGRWEQLCPGGWECKRPEVGAGPSGPAPFCQSSLPPSPWLDLGSQRAPGSPGSRLWAQPCCPLCQPLQRGALVPGESTEQAENLGLPWTH